MRHLSALSTVIELIGLGLLVWGTYLFDPRAALLIGGLVTVLIGIAIDSGPSDRTPDQ